jgi:hypothetical protein
MRTHVAIIGIVLLAFSVFQAALGLLAILAFLGVTVIASVMVQVPWLGFLATGFGFLLGVALVVLAAPGILAGWGLLGGNNWGRILAILLLILHLFNFPIGTVFAIYGLYILLQPETKAMFEERYREEF